MTQHYFDAEDLTQETFLAFYKALPGFDGENPSGFLTRIATNKCLDYLKRAERRTVAAEDEVFAAVPAGYLLIIVHMALQSVLLAIKKERGEGSV